eukprot:5977034-Pyramimonas_sp.AAC.1
MMRVTCAILMRLMWPNPWGVSAAKIIPRLEADMFVYYDKQQVPHHNMVNILSDQMFPTARGPTHAGGILKLKASE